MSEKKKTEKCENKTCDCQEEKAACECTEEKAAKKTKCKKSGAQDELNQKIKDAEDKYLRLLAEFDNFRKRTAKEKLQFTETAVCDTVKNFLPLLDNLQRATSAGGDADAVKRGVEMVEKQFYDILKNLGVEEIEATTFDPNYHNAVLHIDDESLGENEIVQVLQKGYKRGDTVLRHSMVQVAN